MTVEAFKEIAEQLEARGAVTEARQLQKITDRPQVMVPAKVVEAVRLLKVVQTEASKDPSLVNVAARASLLSHQIQAFYARR
jgi:hypothetical protein